MKYLIVLLLSGCVSIYSDWKQVYPPSVTREWHQVSRTQMYALCAIDARVSPNLAACGMQLQTSSRCDVFSYLSEAEAKSSFNAENIWEHEMKHCDGYRHT